MKLLVSRVQAILKRIDAETAPAEPAAAGIAVDREHYTVTRDGHEIALPRKEFALLDLLYSSPGKLFSREEIYTKIWGTEVVVGDRTIDVHIRKLRQKIGDERIVTVKGVGCHGAMPETGVDPINIAAHIYLALQEITARELPAKTPAIVTMGKFSAGHAPNIIPQEAVIEGTIRTFDRDVTALILRRIGEIADATARAFRGSASVEELASAPPLKNDEALTEQMARCAEMLFGEKSVYRLREGGMGSEDFASYTYELPCAYLLLGAGTAQEDARYGKPMHNESVVFNENILPRGSALLAYGAMQWLEDRQ